MCFAHACSMCSIKLWLCQGRKINSYLRGFAVDKIDMLHKIRRHLKPSLPRNICAEERSVYERGASGLGNQWLNQLIS